LEDDLDLTTQYYRLRGQYIQQRQILDNYRRYGALAPLLTQFSLLCQGFVHALANGLNAIRSKLERISGEKISPKHTPVFAHAKALCDVCGWRLYALQEVGPNPPEHAEPINLPQWMPRILDTLAVWSGATIEFHSAESRLIVADYDNTLRLALSEPILNAFQASPNSERVSVSLHKLSDRAAQIGIAATGPGLPLDAPEECFDLRFTSGPFRYGLGLHVAQKIVEKHRGTFRLCPEPGQGVRTIISLPTGDPQPEWDDENMLVRGLENLYDTVAEQRREIRARQATHSLPREQMLDQLSHLFGQLSASTAHLIASGLSRIRDLLHPLCDQVAGEILESLQFILQKCDYCDVVLSNARALDPDAPLQTAPVDLNRVAAQAVRLMAWRAQPGTQLRLEQTTTLPAVAADETLVAAALVNVLRNALDAAEQNGLVDVETLHNEETVIVRVTNTGRTIRSEAHARVFDLDYTTRPNRKYGLGLHVVKTIAARHDGSVAVADAPESQTRLEFALPRSV
jgi:signal transduction histidine kinase